jgi:nitrite reductase/ring-hydroxylating ferredoxin subunit
VRRSRAGAALADAPGEAHISTETLRIACPWHGWEYDLETGQSFMGAGEPGVRSYGVALEPGRSLIAPSEEPRTTLVRGPHTAETFPVRVEDEYVVLEV